ncbi:MAG: GatB/YqeY domain-containing protein, partial [Sphingomonadales bacterium]|nr:GatB/YqeY domain-containing protein [Sphingomonadales bacterium]
MTSPANILKDRLRQDLKVAMQAKRGETAKVLRVILAAIDNAEAVPITESRATQPARFGDGSAEAPRRRLSPDELA